MAILVDGKRHAIHYKFLLEPLGENKVDVNIFTINLIYLLNINICNRNKYIHE